MNLYKPTFLDKNNKSSAKVSTLYRMLIFYNICYDSLVSYDFFNFFWNMFNFKAIKYFLMLPFTYKAIE